MISPKNWVLHIDPNVHKILKRIQQNDAEKILGIIKLLSTDPYFGDIQKLKDDHNVWRRRVGAFRIFYKIKSKEKVILVFHLERRTSNTY